MVPFDISLSPWTIPPPLPIPHYYKEHVYCEHSLKKKQEPDFGCSQTPNAIIHLITASISAGVFFFFHKHSLVLNLTLTPSSRKWALQLCKIWTLLKCCCCSLFLAHSYGVKQKYCVHTLCILRLFVAWYHKDSRKCFIIIFWCYPAFLISVCSLFTPTDNSVRSFWFDTCCLINKIRAPAVYLRTNGTLLCWWTTKLFLKKRTCYFQIGDNKKLNKEIGEIYWTAIFFIIIILFFLSLSRSKVETPMITSPDICTQEPVFTFKQTYIAVQKVEWQHIAERFHTCVHEHTYHTRFTQSAKNVSSKDVQAFRSLFVRSKSCFNRNSENVFWICSFDLPKKARNGKI